MRPRCVAGEDDSGGGGSHLREGEGHQSPTNHYKVQNVPQVAEVRALMEEQAQHHHLDHTEHVSRHDNTMLAIDANYD